MEKFYRFIVSERTNMALRCEGAFDTEEEAWQGEWSPLLPSRYRCILRGDQLSLHDWLIVGNMNVPDAEEHTDEDCDYIHEGDA